MIIGRRPVASRRVHVTALLVWLAGTTFATVSGGADALNESSSRPWDLSQLMQERTRVSHARARFTEERHSALLEAPLILSGTLRYDAPARVEKHTQTPFEEHLLVDGETLVVKRGKKPPRTLSLHEHPALWAFVESMRATLSGDLKTLQKFYNARLEGVRQHWRLVLVPLDDGMSGRIESIYIQGNEAHISDIEIREVGGDGFRMSIYPDRS